MLFFFKLLVQSIQGFFFYFVVFFNVHSLHQPSDSCHLNEAKQHLIIGAQLASPNSLYWYLKYYTYVRKSYPPFFLIMTHLRLKFASLFTSFFFFPLELSTIYFVLCKLGIYHIDYKLWNPWKMRLGKKKQASLWGQQCGQNLIS